VLLESNVKAIGAARVTLEQKGRIIELENDAVIINVGGVLPTSLLKDLGISITTKYGTE
jgi:thioredoxin reductase (NADPH)